MDNAQTNTNLHDEELEGFYEVIVPAVNVRKEAGISKKNAVIDTVMKTEIVECDGTYAIDNEQASSSKWLHIMHKGISGFVKSSCVVKL